MQNQSISVYAQDGSEMYIRVDKLGNPWRNPMMTFGKRLKALRRDRGIGIKSLAPDLGVTYSYLSKLESDGGSPSEEFVGRVSTYFDYDQSELLLEAGKVPPDVLAILRANPQDAVAFLRERFGGVGATNKA